MAYDGSCPEEVCPSDASCTDEDDLWCDLFYANEDVECAEVEEEEEDDDDEDEEASASYLWMSAAAGAAALGLTIV